MFDLSLCAQLSLSLCYPCWGSTKGVMLQSLWKDREEIGEPAKGQGSLRPREVSVARDSHLHPCPALYLHMWWCTCANTDRQIYACTHTCTYACRHAQEHFLGAVYCHGLGCSAGIFYGLAFLFISSQGRSVYPLGLNVTYLGIDLRCKGFFWLNELSWFE